jgi:hypothetical protein
MRRVLTVLCLLAATRSTHATVVIPADLAELSRDARAIVRGHVVSVEGRWTDDRRTIETLVTLEVEHYLKGDLGTLVQFTVPGGRLGRFRNVVIGAPQFETGQRVIVFLGATGPTIPYLLGLHQGVYRVTAEANSGWVVAPAAALPEPGGPVVRGARRPSSLQDFERDVRALAEARR